MTVETPRIEIDSLGEVEIPDDALWGAQSQRALQNFAIGDHVFPTHFIHSFALVKKAAASVNLELDLLDKQRADLIQQVCSEIMEGLHDQQFPLSVWQTGSGTQTNMNVNEVIANRGNQLAGRELGSKSPLHPNDHVNLSQSSNDVFPTVMHLATVELLSVKLLPSLAALRQTLEDKSRQFDSTIKTGRTHMMDATPVTLGQEFAAFAEQVDYADSQIQHSARSLQQLAIGGTAVGNGLHSHKLWAANMAEEISSLSGYKFHNARNLSSQMASHDILTSVHAQLTSLASAVYKIASDIRLMNSGPRCGLAEIFIPENEAGSSIMPGKVNPTQVEALTMVCIRVLGNHTVVTMANSQGQFQLNTYKPLLIHTIMESISLLADSISSFTDNCLLGVSANIEGLKSDVEQSLMLVTALTPVIGYDAAAKIARHAQSNGVSLKQAASDLGIMNEQQFDEAVDPQQMLGPYPGQ